ncbi:MAG: hypothetical protein SGJ20_18165 [Planctomycetota bacterium]|nr:hypothetical protein [Planctomycetota bacterium]
MRMLLCCAVACCLGTLLISFQSLQADEPADPSPPADVAPIAGQRLPENEFAKKATWDIPTREDVRKQVQKWLDSEKIPPEQRTQIETLWPAEDATPIDSAALLNRLVQSFAVAYPDVTPIVELCSKPRAGSIHPKFAILTDEKNPAFVRNNLRLYYGRWLGQERFYDEALEQLSKLEPTQVVDPASLLFYQSATQHWLLQKKEGLQSIAKLFERREQLPRRYETVAMLMQADLAALEDETLDHISRRMNDITRRLELGRAGKKVRGVEDGVIASLDKLIEDLESQQSSSSSSSSEGEGKGGPGGKGSGKGQGTTPNQGSIGPGTKTDGIANSRGKSGNKNSWGDLPAKEREEAMQQIGKDFPSHYRDIIESYFRRIAESD